jgi:TonB family protein
MDALPLVLASVRVIGWALVHFVWQAAVLGLLYAIVRNALPRGEVRYRFGMGMLVVLAICPMLTVWRLMETASPVIQAVTDVVTPNVAAGGGVTTGAAWIWDTGLDALLPWLVLGWSFGVLLLSLRAWRQWRELKALVRMAELMPLWQGRVTAMASRFGLRRHVTVLCSKVIATPALVGWIRPVILLPMVVACNFPAVQIELILAHELAHLRRWDPLANLFQVVLETLHFYHPVVHWISRDVRNEREICCDELALSISGGSRHEFVTALAELGELRVQHGSLLLAASGGVLLDRVQQIVLPMHGAVRMRTPARFVAVLLGAALVALTVRLEWKQEQLQRELGNSLVQLQSMLAPQWLLPTSSTAWHMPDLRLRRAEVARPLPTAGPAIAVAQLFVSAAAAVELPRLTPLRVADLALVRGQSPAYVVEQVAPATAWAAPAPIHMRQPIYPQNALMRGIEGRVVLEFSLAADGSVRDLHAISAAPAGVFDQAAIQAMRGWKYSLPASAMEQGRYRQTMAFTLNATGHNTASAGAEIQAQIGCQVVIGTHICRWLDDSGPNAAEAAKFAERH